MGRCLGRKGVITRTGQEIQLLRIFPPWAPSCPEVAGLLLEGLKQELERLPPRVDASPDGDDDAFRHGIGELGGGVHVDICSCGCCWFHLTGSVLLSSQTY